MKRKKLVYIVSDIDKALHFEWIAPVLNQTYQLSFIMIGAQGTALELFLRQNGIEVWVFTLRDKKDVPKIWVKTFWRLFRIRPDIVHTHLWKANLIGLSASFFCGVKKRIFTRHHATIHYTEHPSGRRWDQVCNALATHIIAISKNVEDILVNWDHADKKKVVVVHHGFDLDYLREVPVDRVAVLQQKYGLQGKRPIVGVISRFIEWKGIQYIIPAVEKLRSSYPEVHLILANANGSYTRVITEMLSDFPAGSYTTIAFEHDLAALYRLFDVFVHVPVDENAEAFGQTYVEAPAAGIPCVFTLSGVAPEFIKPGENALVVDFRNADQVYDAIVQLLADADLRERLRINGMKALENFSIKTYLDKIMALYSK
jgi:glycosyltransferase involved in cell wall biosynthesis